MNKRNFKKRIKKESPSDDDEESTTVLIRNLDKQVSASDLITSVFPPEVEIVRATVHVNEKGESLGTAEVIFRTQRAAEEAYLTHNGRILHNKPMRLSLLQAQVKVIRPVILPDKKKKKKKPNTRVIEISAPNTTDIKTFAPGKPRGWNAVSGNRPGKAMQIVRREDGGSSFDKVSELGNTDYFSVQERQQRVRTKFESTSLSDLLNQLGATRQVLTSNSENNQIPTFIPPPPPPSATQTTLKPIPEEEVAYGFPIQQTNPNNKTSITITGIDDDENDMNIQPVVSFDIKKKPKKTLQNNNNPKIVITQKQKRTLIKNKMNDEEEEQEQEEQEEQDEIEDDIEVDEENNNNNTELSFETTKSIRQVITTEKKRKK